MFNIFEFLFAKLTVSLFLDTFHRIPAYASTKGNFIANTADGCEYAPYNIRVNAVNPGTIATQLVKNVLSKSGVL